MLQIGYKLIIILTSMSFIFIIMTSVSILHLYYREDIMPKVKEEHFIERANKIVDGAIRVCRTKPAHAVTLRDVVKECGISQGGMYNYFTSIDEIFVEILNRAYGEFQIADSANEIFESGKSLSTILMESFAIIGKLTDDMIAKYGKILYEISDIYAGAPERVVKVIDKIKVTDDTNAVIGMLMTLIDQNVSSGAVKLKMPREHILLLIGVTVQGIVRTVAFTNSAEMIKAQTGVDDEYTSAQGMMKILAQTVIQMVETIQSE